MTPTQKLSYNVNEAAAAVGVGRTKLYDLINRGELQTFRLDGRTLIRADVLASFVDRVSRQFAA